MEVLALHHFHLQITVTVNDTKVRAYKADSQLVSTPYGVLWTFRLFKHRSVGLTPSTSMAISSVEKMSRSGQF